MKKHWILTLIVFLALASACKNKTPKPKTQEQAPAVQTTQASFDEGPLPCSVSKKNTPCLNIAKKEEKIFSNKIEEQMQRLLKTTIEESTTVGKTGAGK